MCQGDFLMSKFKVDIVGIDTNKLKVLKNEEMVDLFKAMKSGDDTAKEKIINGNLKLVLSIISKFRNKDIDISIFKNKDLKIDYKQLLEKPKIYFEQIDLDIQLGTEDAAITAILTGVIASVLGVILRKPKYQIIPVYANRNFVKVKLDCIISVHLMQYIYKIISNKVKDLGKVNLNKKVEV